MKTISSCLHPLPFLICLAFASCNSSDIDSGNNITADLPAASRTAADFPANANNPYDYAGLFHYELYNSYYQSGSLPTTVGDIALATDSIARSNSSFNAIAGSSYSGINAGKLQYILSHEATAISYVINEAPMSVNGKASLSGFISALLPVFGNGDGAYNPTYDLITSYESSVPANGSLSAADKKIIFITTSVARYSTYEAQRRPKKNKDTDWEKLIANISGSISGSSEGAAAAITTALAAGVAENQ